MKFQDGNDSYRPHTEQNLISEILFSDIRFCEVRGRGSEQLQQTFSRIFSKKPPDPVSVNPPERWKSLVFVICAAFVFVVAGVSFCILNIVDNYFICSPLIYLKAC